MPNLLIDLHLSIHINSKQTQEEVERAIRSSIGQGNIAATQLFSNLHSRLAADTAKGTLVWSVTEASKRSAPTHLPETEIAGVTYPWPGADPAPGG